MFIFITGLVALTVALCAAFFSVQGIAALYTGHYWSVVLMASGLEVGKLVAASYLHRFWSKTSILLKFYLTIAVIILMAITSLGVFGFLSSAYQVNFAKVELVDTKQQSLNEIKMELDIKG
jgi:amino acid permease